jgi:hypothetical protein
MKALALVFIGIVAASGCSKLLGPRVTDSGKQGNKTISAGPGKTLASFTRVKSYGAFDVEVRQGPQSDVVIEGDENIVKIVDCTVEDDSLIIKTTEDYTTSTRLLVRVTMPAIEGLDLKGSGSIVASEVSGDKLDLELSGSGEITVHGKVRNLSADVSGSGGIKAAAVEAEDATVDISGSGSVQVFANKTLNAEISGSGDVRYKGSPTLKKDINGSGEVGPM